MAAMNATELASYTKRLSSQLLGGQLQDIWTDGKCLVLEIFKNRPSFLVLDLNQQHPDLILLDQRPGLKKLTKPVTLFLKSHAKNSRLLSLTQLPEFGRVLQFEFGTAGGSCRCLLVMIPRAVNFSIEAQGKKLSWMKPKDLQAQEPKEFPIQESVEIQERAEQWLARQSQGSKTALKENTSKPAAKDVALEKKRKLLDKLKENLLSDEPEQWRQFGELLKSSSELPDSLKKYYDSKKTRSENLTQAFHMAKELERKAEGLAQRVKKIEEEITALEQGDAESAAPAKPALRSQILKKTESRGRSFKTTGGFEAVFGKSAAENLAILRQARAWDYWLHLKDYPSSHAILFREKNQNVPDQDIEQVAKWLIKEKMLKKDFSLGGKFAVIVVECRFVRPIRGDKHGLVTYQNPRVYTFAS